MEDALDEDLEADPDRTTFSNFAAPLLDRPRLLPHQTFIYDAFRDLFSERPVGFGLGHIPWSKILAYATWVGFTSFEDQRWFKRRVQAVDQEYLKLVNEERKEEEEIRKQEQEQREQEKKLGGLQGEIDALQKKKT